MKKKYISSEKLIQSYQNLLGINVQHYLKDRKIQLLHNQTLGFDYFLPNELAGDSSFYKMLSQKSWYYEDWKWEHQIAFKYISSTNSVLEIGCGKGSFLEFLYREGIKCTGLELGISRSKAPQILDQSIQEFSLLNKANFDVVCGFQVLEHISEIDSFIESALNCLKSEGKLIFAVPNNNSFIKYAGYNDPLNFPPHHMSRWTVESFKKTAFFFNLKVSAVHYEPLQPYHLDWFIKIHEELLLRKFSTLYKIYIVLKIGILFKKIVELIRSKIKGHTILIVMEKK